MGRHEEEMPASTGDLLQELSQLHERARQVMHDVAQALWPSSFLPNGMGELADLLQGARRRFHLWKISAMLARSKRSLGDGEDALYQAGP